MHLLRELVLDGCCLLAAMLAGEVICSTSASIVKKLTRKKEAR